MSSSKQVEIRFEDPNPQKWCHPLKEDVYAALKNKENSLLHKTGSLFSPLLFGKFFDPSDAFPLWEFESDSLLPSSCTAVDWFQTDTEYVLRAAEIPGLSQDNIEVCIENGKILEISGQQRECRTKDWKKCKWWEHGYVRRIELPDQAADWRKAVAYVKNDVVLEIKIPKTDPPDSHTT